jgi:protein O-mannosyl-transferase
MLLGMTAAAYGPLWHNDFIDYDDEPNITNNPWVTAGLSWSGLSWAWNNDQAPYLMPLTWMSFQLDAHFFSAADATGNVFLCPAAFHGENLAWHAASALLLFGLLRRLTGALWRSFLVAALFAVHPMHVESVAWAAERKDVLSVFFGLVTLWAYAWYVERPGWWRSLVVGSAFLLSLLCKPMLMTLPFVLLLLDYWPLRRPLTPRRLVREKIPLFALAALFAVVTLVSRYDNGALVSLDTVSLTSRAANALTAYGWYLFTTFYPAQLAILYPHPYENWSPAAALAGAAALLSVSAFAVWQARRRPWLIVGWLWFVGSLLPVIGFAQGGKQAWADRFSYWPHVGLFVAVVWGLGELALRARVPAWLAGVAAALVVGCLGALTWVQVGYWRDTPTLWEHAVAVTGDNLVAEEHLVGYYLGRGLVDQATPHLEAARRLETDRLRALLHKGPAAGRPAPPASSSNPSPDAGDTENQP